MTSSKAPLSRRTFTPALIASGRTRSASSAYSSISRGPWQSRVGDTLGLLFLTTVLSTAAPAADENWGQWRGPRANGVAPLADPPTTWSETQNVKWKVAIPGRGTSTPIVWGNQIFLQTAIPTGKPAEAGAGGGAGSASKPTASWTVASPVFGQPQPGAGGPPGDAPRRRGPGGGGPGGGGRGGGEKPTEVFRFALVSVDRGTGRIQWQKALREEVPHEGHHRDHGYASHSPITDGEHVYAWLGSRGLHCLDLKGEVLWSKDLGKMRTVAGFGEGSSPALHGDTLIVNWDHEGDDFIAAFDKRTGKERWRQSRDEKTTWTTPLVVTYEGKTQVIVAATQRIRSYDLATGQPLWECGGMTANVIPSPVSDFGMLYAISGFRGNALLAIKLGKNGDLTDTDAIAWRQGKATPYVPSPLLFGENLYFLSGNNAILSCFDAKTGQPRFAEERLTGPSGFYASPVGAADRVYLAGRNGTSVVLKNTGKPEVLATNVLDDPIDASPAACGKELFLRGHQHLYCLAEK